MFTTWANKEKGILYWARFCEPNIKEPTMFKLLTNVIWSVHKYSFCYVCKFEKFISKNRKINSWSLSTVFHLPEPYVTTCIQCICTLLSLWALSNFVTHARCALFTFLIKYMYTSNLCYRSALPYSANKYSEIIGWQPLSIVFKKREREKRWHAEEAWPKERKREKMACQKSMTQKNNNNKEERESVKKGVHIHSPLHVLAWSISKYKCYLYGSNLWSFNRSDTRVCLQTPY